jgi:hypothetical protein
MQVVHDQLPAISRYCGAAKLHQYGYYEERWLSLFDCRPYLIDINRTQNKGKNRYGYQDANQ